jgi:ATP-dependent helicase YprA (DUF1998 family)
MLAENPPDILLTNYVMAELILTRFDHADKKVVESASQGLEFLVLDELHTYRGRQGADVAMLVRRMRDRFDRGAMRCVGTSATIAGKGRTLDERQDEMAYVATQLFGDKVDRDHVIGETLQSAVSGVEPTTDAIRTALHGTSDYPADYAALANHPLAGWIETAFGVRHDEQGRLERKTPVTLNEAAAGLSKLTGVAVESCKEHLQSMLLAGYQAKDPESDRRLFAFRLHQFVSRGDTVYSSLEKPGERYLAMEGQVFVPGDRSRILLPLAFCRQCGQEYFVVARHSRGTLEGRRLSDAELVESEPGYLFPDPDDIWGTLPLEERLPENWLRMTKDGTPAVTSYYKKSEPQQFYASPGGQLSDFPDDDSLPGSSARASSSVNRSVAVPANGVSNVAAHSRMACETSEASSVRSFASARLAP